MGTVERKRDLIKKGQKKLTIDFSKSNPKKAKDKTMSIAKKHMI